MNTIPNWAFEARAAQPFQNPPLQPTNDILPALPALARQLVRVQPWLANRPELMPGTPLAAMEWPAHATDYALREWPAPAVRRFNRTVVNERLAAIGTALAQPYAHETAVGQTLRQAHFYALLVRHQEEPLRDTAYDTARALYERERQKPLGPDNTRMEMWLDMRPHYFGKTARVYGDAMAGWAEHGVPQEAFYYDGAVR